MKIEGMLFKSVIYDIILLRLKSHVFKFEFLKSSVEKLDSSAENLKSLCLCFNVCYVVAIVLYRLYIL